jgi:hypothetical protein
MTDDIAKVEGDTAAEKAGESFDEFLEVVLGRTDKSTGKHAVANFVKALALPFLTFAQIPNFSQSITANLLSTDARAVAFGLKAAFTKKGVYRAMESGAITQQIQGQTASYMGASGSKTGGFLKAIGFSTIERTNRIITANVGENWAIRSFERMQNGGRLSSVWGKKEDGQKFYAQALEELGIDANKALKRGKLTGNELLTAGQKLSEKTQFLNRPMDMPIWASSPIGSIFYQYKTFAIKNTELIFKKALLGNLRGRGRRGKIRALRNFAILTTAYPATGEVVADMTSLVTGKERPTKALDRYLSNMGAASSFGITANMMTASQYNRSMEMFGGPGPTQTFSGLDSVFNFTGKFDADGILNQAIDSTQIGLPISNRINRRNTADKETTWETFKTGGRNLEF